MINSNWASTDSIAKNQPRHSRNFIELFDYSNEHISNLIDQTLRSKARGPNGLREPRLEGRVLGLVFEKPSMRTRISFQAAMAHLGGTALYFSATEIGLGTREPIKDFSRIISQYVDVLAVRTFKHERLEEIAESASIPVINALTEAAHPCQAMSDLVTIKESLGKLKGLQIAFVGEGNNVARSLAVASAKVGAHFTLACPVDYSFPNTFLERYRNQFPQNELKVEHDPLAAVSNADVVYTDVWCSMGHEAEMEQRIKHFKPFQVNEHLFRHARPNAIFLHCLPAKREEEVASNVIDGPQSRVVLQAANRLHFQKTLLHQLLNSESAWE